MTCSAAPTALTLTHAFRHLPLTASGQTARRHRRPRPFTQLQLRNGRRMWARHFTRHVIWHLTVWLWQFGGWHLAVCAASAVSMRTVVVWRPVNGVLRWSLVRDVHLTTVGRCRLNWGDVAGSGVATRISARVRYGEMMLGSTRSG